MDLDFGYGEQQVSEPANAPEENNDSNGSTNLGTGNVEHDPNGAPADDLDSSSNNEENNSPESNNGNQTNDNSENNESDEPLKAGTTVEVGNDTYTVDENGNLLDANGNIFKEAAQVQEWMKGFDNVEEGTDNISIYTIKQALDIEITDDNNNPIEYDNTPEGIKSYVNDVIELAKEDNFNTAYRTLFTKYPFVKDIMDYYIANGNSLEGYHQMPDRSGIVVDDNNEAQQEAIIRTSWKEQNRKGDIDGYIAYLKSAGTLATTAREELKAIQEMDAQRSKQLEQAAEQRRQEETARIQAYWQEVYNTIQSKQLAGYKIPDNIIVERNGKKFAATPNDFFNYVYRVDENGYSQYQHDLANVDPQDRQNDELLRAYLMFTGGNYSNLVDMAINEQKVNTLKLVAKQRNNSTIRINRPKPSGKKAIDIDLGYN